MVLELIRKNDTTTSHQELENNANHGAIYLKDAYANMKSIFDSAYASGDKETKKKLAEFAKKADSKS